MARKKKQDPESEAAMDVVRREIDQEQQADQERQEEQEATARTHRAIGACQAMGLMRAVSDLTVLMQAREVKETKAYKPAGYTWAEFCEAIDIPVRTMDERLADLRPFGQEFLGRFAKNISPDFRKIRQLSMAIQDGELAELPKIDEDSITYGGETVSLSDREGVQALLDRLNDEATRRAEEAEAETRAARRLAEQKEKALDKAYKQLDRHERRAAAAELSADEEAYVDKVSELRNGLHGYMKAIDNQLELREGEATQVMVSSRIALLDEFRRITRAAYDETIEYWGHIYLDQDIPDEADDDGYGGDAAVE